MDLRDLITEQQYKELYNDYLKLFKGTDITFKDFLTKTFEFIRHGHKKNNTKQD